jgi:hypothetical protein
VKLALALLLASCVEAGGLGGDRGACVGDCVYECAAPTRTVEVCYPGEAAELELDTGWLDCRPTSRHAGPCIHRCPGEPGCNALNGCFCGGEED